MQYPGEVKTYMRGRMQLAKPVQERDEVLRLDLGPFRRECEGRFDDTKDGYDLSLSLSLRHSFPGLAVVSRYERGRCCGFGETQSCVLEGSGETHEAQELQTRADQRLFLARLRLGGVDI